MTEDKFTIKLYATFGNQPPTKWMVPNLNLQIFWDIIISKKRSRDFVIYDASNPLWLDVILNMKHYQ